MLIYGGEDGIRLKPADEPAAWDAVAADAMGRSLPDAGQRRQNRVRPAGLGLLATPALTGGNINLSPRCRPPGARPASFRIATPV